MKISQAKAIAGIQYTLKTRSDYAHAEKVCVNLIAAARKTGDDNRAAELSEAKSIFQKRARGGTRCAVCSVTIARGATHCVIHGRQQKKMITAPIEWQPESKPKRKGNNNERIALFPKGGHLATLGYYSTPVQKIVTKWRGQIAEDVLKHYFGIVAMPLHYPGIHLHANNEKPRYHWRAIYELGTAIGSLLDNPHSPEAWLLNQPQLVIGKPSTSWNETIQNIVKQGGRRFTENQLKQAAKKMKLLTPPEVARVFRQEFESLCHGTIQDSKLYSVVSKNTLK